VRKCVEDGGAPVGGIGLRSLVWGTHPLLRHA
jgi:hypothetical protein